MEPSKDISKQFSLKSSVVFVCLATVVVLFNLFTAIEARQCSMFTEFTILNAKKPCRKCPKCPIGYGLPVQCGLRVKNGTSTDCIPCAANTYSITNDSTACKPCHECDGKKILKNCTATQNRVCDNTCADPNYYLDSEMDECKECFFCCEDVPDGERLQQCKDIGMPINRQCKKTAKNQQCKLAALKKTTTSSTPTVSTARRTVNMTVSQADNPHSPDLESPSKPPPAPIYENNENNNSPASADEDYKGYYIVGGVLGGIFLIFITVKFHKSRRHSEDGNTADVESQDDENERSVLVHGPESSTNSSNDGEQERSALVHGPESSANSCNGDQHEMSALVHRPDSSTNSFNDRCEIETAPTLENGIPEDDEHEMSVLVHRPESSANSSNDDQHEMSVLVNGAESSINSSNDRCEIETAPTLENGIPESVKLDKFPYYGEDFILKLDITLTGVKNWRHVACQFNVSNFDVQLIEQDGRSPTRVLIDKLCTQIVSLKRFVDVLQELERHDVANDILKWYRENSFRL